METSTSRMNAPAAAIRPAAIADLVGRCIALIRRELRIRRAADTLLALDDHLLADIALERSEVIHAVRHGRRNGGRGPNRARQP